MKIVGLSCRTDNASEMNPQTAQIGATVGKYMQTGIAQQVANAVTPFTTYSVYTEYESDHTGKYTYIIGTEVTSFEGQPQDLIQITIPAQTYAKFTNGPAPMPMVSIEAWQQIWPMTSEDFGGKRAYQADLEVYDERALDLQNATLDILIGIFPGDTQTAA